MATVSKSSIDGAVYRVSNEGEYGTIVILAKEKSVEVLCLTSYGSFNHYWSNTGPDPLSFLCEIDLDYAMQKFKGKEGEEIDWETLGTYLKNKVFESRKNGDLSSLQARILFNDIQSGLIESNDPSFVYDADLGEFLNYDVEIPYKWNSSCHGFWEKIWKPLIDHIKKEKTND